MFPQQARQRGAVEGEAKRSGERVLRGLANWLAYPVVKTRDTSRERQFTGSSAWVEKSWLIWATKNASLPFTAGRHSFFLYLLSYRSKIRALLRRMGRSRLTH